MVHRPKIGLTTRLESITGRFYLGREYSEALEAHGAVPVLIPLIPSEEYIRNVVSELDGVLLPGCDSDPDPALYGENPHPKLGAVIPEKDQTDLLVLAEAEKRNLPVLAICFGVQILNVHRGGTLIQDIESEVTDCVQHRQIGPRERLSHHIEVSEPSFLETVLADSSFDKLMVNSHHHQSIRNVGKDLTITAYAPDGVAECVEQIDDVRFVLGVQWHPELAWKTDPLSNAIFSAFVGRCSGRKSSATMSAA